MAARPADTGLRSKQAEETVRSFSMVFTMLAMTYLCASWQALVEQAEEAGMSGIFVFYLNILAYMVAPIMPLFAHPLRRQIYADMESVSLAPMAVAVSVVLGIYSAEQAYLSPIMSANPRRLSKYSMNMCALFMLTGIGAGFLANRMRENRTQPTLNLAGDGEGAAVNP